LLQQDAASVEEIEMGKKEHRLGVSEINLVVRHLKLAPVDVSHDWWTHFKEGYYKCIDGNVKDNANHEPWSCHQIPLAAGRKR
jgi:hypothetical protein